MNKTLLLILTAALLVVITPFSIAIASDIADAVFFGTVRATNTSAVAPNVSVNLSINSGDWIDNGTLNAAANNTAIRNSTGADTEFMPGYDSNPWIVQFDTVPDNGNIDSTLYTNATGGKIRYFPGSTGMTVADNNTNLEPGANFTASISGWVDTTASANKTLIDKEKALSVYVSSTVSGDITAAIGGGLLDEVWTEVGTKITVAASRLDYEAERTAVDNRAYYDVGILSDTAWKIEYTHRFTSVANAGRFFFGIWDTLANANGYPGDSIWVELNNTPTARGDSEDGGVSGANGDIGIVAGTTYYVTLERTSAISATLSYYSDAARTVHIAGSPKVFVVAAGIDNLRYIQASNFDDSDGAASEQIGWIESLILNDVVSVSVTATGVTSGERIVTVSADTANLTISVDGAISGAGHDSIALGGATVLDNSANWTFVANDSMPYMETANITIDGVLQGSWEWEYDTTFTDLSGQSHDATPSFRTTSSDADVSASLITFKPILEAKVTDSTSITWPVIMEDPPDEPGTAYSENITPGIFFAPFIHTIAEFGASNWSGATTDMLEQLFWYQFAFVIIMVVSVFVFFFFAANKKEALFIKIFATVAVMIFFALPGINIYGLYVPLYYVFFATGILMLKKDFGW